MKRKTHKEILEGFKHHDARGSDIYVVRSIEGLVESNEIIDGSITRLRQTIKNFNSKSEKQTNTVILLTKVIAGLTVLMLIGLAIQIVLARGG